MIFRIILLTFSTYSVIPLPSFKLKGGEERYMLCALPLVGAVLGAIEAALFYLCTYLLLPDMATVLLLCALPILFTGGIHVDGLMDTADAKHSWRGKEERLKILKDPHIGAFAVIRLLIYLMLLWAAGLTVIADGDGGITRLLLFAAVFVFSRSSCAVSSLLLPSAKNEGMLYSAKQGGRGRVFIPLVILIAAVAAAVYLDPVYALLQLALQLILAVYYCRMTDRSFGGINGDTAGWYICMSELLSVAAMAVRSIMG
ncbi:MAG: adenosylcobinamide-GDP ribazoletransferase [Lachnospiraceae bacterium]|nr:adenosylcobinamide-GDP ribazoletransferase [Lachnospiraceae bacterium]